MTNLTDKKTLVLGASEKPSRYSHLAILMLRENAVPVLALGLREGRVGDVKIVKEKEKFEGVHTVTMYMNAQNQEAYEDYILSLNPKRVVFNPGAEHPEFMKRCEDQGIETMEACTLVLLRSHQY